MTTGLIQSRIHGSTKWPSLLKVAIKTEGNPKLLRRKSPTAAEMINQALAQFGLELMRSATFSQKTVTMARDLVQRVMEALVPAIPLIQRNFDIGDGGHRTNIAGLLLPGVFEQDVILLPNGQATGTRYYKTVALAELVLRGSSDQERVETAITALEILEKYLFQADDRNSRQLTKMQNLQQRLGAVLARQKART